MHIKKHHRLLVLLLLIVTTSISAAYARDISQQVSVPILLYHDIQDTGEGDSTISQEVFLSHLDAIQQAGYETVTFQQLINFVEHEGSLPEKPILITFDDGYLSNYKIAWPALQERGMVGTIFVIGSLVGKDTYKDTGVPTIPHFTYKQAKEMIDSGVMSIQSHTYDLHQYGPLEPDGGREGVLPMEGETSKDYRQVLLKDFLRSRDALHQNTGATIQVLAYPYGLYTQDSEAISTQFGFSVTLTRRLYGAMTQPACT